MSENRAPAQYCPYCGESDLWPHEESHGAWSCHSCRRVFAVRFVGLAASGWVTQGAVGNTGGDQHADAGTGTGPVAVDVGGEGALR